MRRLRQELERLDIRTVALADAAVGCDAAVGWSGGGSWAGGGSQAARSSVAIGSCGSGGERGVLFDSLGCCLLPCEEIALTCSLLCCSLLCILLCHVCLGHLGGPSEADVAVGLCSQLCVLRVLLCEKRLPPACSRCARVLPIRSLPASEL